MYAVGMCRGKPGVRDFEIPKPVIKRPNEVLIRVKEVGLDGTDYGIVASNSPDIADDRDRIVLGHEGVGVVEEIGSGVKSLKVGDVVVCTVRRGCNECEPCLHNQSDMCITGKFTERGIHKIDGLLSEYVTEEEHYAVKVPPELKRLAVLTEPLSVVEKGVHELRVIQSRVPWFCPHPGHEWMSDAWGGCKVALVIGAGPLGLLATALIRLAQTTTYTADIVPEDHPKAILVEEMGSHYIDARSKTPEEIVDLCCTPTGQLNIIFEASGAAKTAVNLIPFMSRSSIYTMTGIPRGDIEIQLDAAQLVGKIVRYNQVIVGSVNSNRSHFEMALKDMAPVNDRMNHVLDKMITRRVSISDYKEAFEHPQTNAVKTVVEVEPWE